MCYIAAAKAEMAKLAVDTGAALIVIAVGTGVESSPTGRTDWILTQASFDWPTPAATIETLAVKVNRFYCADICACEPGQFAKQSCTFDTATPPFPQCRQHRNCVRPVQWEVSAPTDAADRECAACLVCPPGMYEKEACTETTETVCAMWNSCAATNQRTVTAGTPFADVTCGPCSTCADRFYALPGSCSEKGDTVCWPVSDACKSGLFEVSGPSTEADRVCQECSTGCPDGSYLVSDCTQHEDRVCKTDADCEGEVLVRKPFLEAVTTAFEGQFDYVSASAKERVEYGAVSGDRNTLKVTQTGGNEKQTFLTLRMGLLSSLADSINATISAFAIQGSCASTTSTELDNAAQNENATRDNGFYLTCNNLGICSGESSPWSMPSVAGTGSVVVQLQPGYLTANGTAENVLCASLSEVGVERPTGCIAACLSNTFEDDAGHCRDCPVGCPDGTYMEEGCTSFDPPTCSPYATCGLDTDGRATFQRSPGNSRQDVECQPCTVCREGTYATQECTAEADTVCAPWTPCKAGVEFETAPGTISADRTCSECSKCDAYGGSEDGEKLMVPTGSGSGPFSTVAKEYELRQCSPSNDVVCAAVRECGKGEFVTFEPTLTSNRYCTSCRHDAEDDGSGEGGGNVVTTTPTFTTTEEPTSVDVILRDRSLLQDRTPGSQTDASVALLGEEPGTCSAVCAAGIIVAVIAALLLCWLCTGFYSEKRTDDEAAANPKGFLSDYFGTVMGKEGASKELMGALMASGGDVAATGKASTNRLKKRAGSMKRSINDLSAGKSPLELAAELQAADGMILNDDSDIQEFARRQSQKLASVKMTSAGMQGQLKQLDSDKEQLIKMVEQARYDEDAHAAQTATLTSGSIEMTIDGESIEVPVAVGGKAGFTLTRDKRSGSVKIASVDKRLKKEGSIKVGDVVDEVHGIEVTDVAQAKDLIKIADPESLGMEHPTYKNGASEGGVLMTAVLKNAGKGCGLVLSGPQSAADAERTPGITVKKVKSGSSAAAHADLSGATIMMINGDDVGEMTVKECMAAIKVSENGECEVKYVPKTESRFDLGSINEGQYAESTPIAATLYPERSGGQQAESVPAAREQHVVLGDYGGTKASVQKGRKSSRIYFEAEQDAKARQEQLEETTRAVIQARNQEREEKEKRAKEEVAAKKKQHEASIKAAQEAAQEAAAQAAEEKAAAERAARLQVAQAAHEAAAAKVAAEEAEQQKRVDERIAREHAERVAAEERLQAQQATKLAREAEINALKDAGEWIVCSNMIGCKCYDCTEDLRHEAELHQAQLQRNMIAAADTQDYAQAARRRSIELSSPSNLVGIATESADTDSQRLPFDVSNVDDEDEEDVGDYGFPDGAGDDSD